MDTLILKPGGMLLFRSTEYAAGGEGPVEGEVRVLDVSAEAAAYLYEPVQIDAHSTLGDVFALVERCPALIVVFSRSGVESLCVQARQGSLPQDPRGEPPEIAGIEYLELSWAWTLDTSSGTYGNLGLLDVRGAGKVAPVDVPSHGIKAGERVNWSVSLTPVRELLDLPLRYVEESGIREDDIDSAMFGEVVQQAKVPQVLLGQLLHGLFSELSFHGAADDQEEFLARLVALKDGVLSGDFDALPVGDLVPEAELAGFEAMFETVGGVSLLDVRRSMRLMEDDQAAGPWFDDEFAGVVVVRERFRDRTGREFRKAFRAACR